jgi:hypothetical protein
VLAGAPTGTWWFDLGRATLRRDPALEELCRSVASRSDLRAELAATEPVTPAAGL